MAKKNFYNRERVLTNYIKHKQIEDDMENWTYLRSYVASAIKQLIHSIGILYTP